MPWHHVMSHDTPSPLFQFVVRFIVIICLSITFNMSIIVFWSCLSYYITSPFVSHTILAIPPIIYHISHDVSYHIGPTPYHISHLRSCLIPYWPYPLSYITSPMMSRTILAIPPITYHISNDVSYHIGHIPLSYITSHIISHTILALPLSYITSHIIPHTILALPLSYITSHIMPHTILAILAILYTLNILVCET